MKSKPYVIFFIADFLFWMLVFAFSRALFYLFQWRDLHILQIKDIAGSFWHGAHMDASFAGYIALAMAVIILLISWLSAKYTRCAIGGITMILLFLHVFLSIVDSELFRAWGFRIDTTPLMYMNHPSDALASTSVLRIIALILLTLLLFSGLAWIFRNLIYRRLPKNGRAVWWNAPIFLLIGCVCIIPMRGGFGTSTMNQGTVFFSQHALANQAALNMPWNLLFSFVNRNEQQVYTFMPDQEAEAIANPFLEKSDEPDTTVLNTSQPNVIVVIMESFSSTMIEKLGGEKGVTPRFNTLIDKGLLFTDIYADGYRTERGLVAILSGYPSQPTQSVIQSNSKLPKIPMLANDFKQRGYSTAFYYGGDISFVNTRSYVLSAGFQRYTDESDYPDSPKFSWGAHDEAVFEKLLRDLDTVTTPFFYSVLTLSNHEPHTVPIPTQFDDLWKNSTYYADKCIGDFVDAAKTKSWWNNTLLIFTADHGLRQNLPNYAEQAYQIPMLWIGGALKAQNVKVSKLGNQRDIAATLLTQLRMPKNHYKFSSNLLNTNKLNTAFYTYNNGFALVKDSTVVVFDNHLKDVIHRRHADSTTIKQAKALFQVMNNDFLKL